MASIPEAPPWSVPVAKEPEVRFAHSRGVRRAPPSACPDESEEVVVASAATTPDDGESAALLDDDEPVTPSRTRTA